MESQLPGPRVSVIVPNKGRFNVLERAISSVLEQEHKNVEIVIVDDSDDELFQKIEEKYAHFRNIKVQRGKKGGDMVARLDGISLATGDYIAFLDSDDRWNPEKLKEHLNIWENNPGITLSFDKWHDNIYSSVYASLVTHSRRVAIVDGHTIRNMLMVHGNFIHMSSIFTKGSYLNRLVLGAASPKPPFDLYLSYFLSMNSKICFINKLLTEKSDSEDSLGRNRIVMSKERHSILNMALSNLLGFKKPPGVSFKFYIWKYVTILGGIPSQPFLERYSVLVSKIEHKLIKS